RLLVMYAGQVAEAGPTRQVFDSPAHPYSQGLLAAFPSIHGAKIRMTGIPGNPPELISPPPGCRFQPRCPVAMPECAEKEPDLYELGKVGVRCLLHESGGSDHD